MNEPAYLDIEMATAGYHGQAVLNGISLSLPAGRVASLLGASGCGKSTLLRVIAGFEPLWSGSVSLNGKTLSGPGVHRPPHLRGVGMVFQDHALFPHLDVAGNIGFGLQGRESANRSERVAERLEMVGLSDHRSAMPHELSGGQQQRVALARALAPSPGLLLLDEPFANLDRSLRAELARDVRSWLHTSGTTAVVVTHDPVEAFNLADSLGVMADGRLLQWADPATAWKAPASIAAARLMGEISLLQGTSLASGRVCCCFGDIQPAAAVGPGPVDIVLRNGDVRLGGPDDIEATVRGFSFRGDHGWLELELPGGDRVAVSTDPGHSAEPGSTVTVRLAQRHLPCFSLDA